MNTRGQNQTPAKLRKCRHHNSEEWPTAIQLIQQRKEDRQARKQMQQARLTTRLQLKAMSSKKFIKKFGIDKILKARKEVVLNSRRDSICAVYR